MYLTPFTSHLNFHLAFITLISYTGQVKVTLASYLLKTLSGSTEWGRL